jgi:hypothetical protein
MLEVADLATSSIFKWAAVFLAGIKHHTASLLRGSREWHAAMGRKVAAPEHNIHARLTALA